MLRHRPAIAAAAALAFALCACANPAAAQPGSTGLVESASFKRPFKTFDTAGARVVPNFAFGGSTDVNENFIRITPDRASKRGWIWQKSPLGLDEWSTTLRFRVSGQGKRLFGDGFALWFTQNKYYADGPLHGIKDTFAGFGIVFDTFRNSELAHVHMDVALYASDGSAPVDPSTFKNEEVRGCSADFRYWEGREDFSVLSQSVVRLSFTGGKLSVYIDAKDSGNFVTCLDNVNLPTGLATDWHKTAYIGLTATTGQLADNHDILSLLVSSNPSELLNEKAVTAAVELVSAGNSQLDAAIAAAVAAEVASLTEKLTSLHHTLEHELSAVNDALTSNINKLREQDQRNLERIVEMEKRLHEKVDTDVERHVKDAIAGSNSADGVAERLSEMERSLKDEMDSKIVDQLEPTISDAVERHAVAAGHSWKLPFLLLLLVIGGLAGFAYKKYRHLMKTHLL